MELSGSGLMPDGQLCRNYSMCPRALNFSCISIAITNVLNSFTYLLETPYLQGEPITDCIMLATRLPKRCGMLDQRQRKCVNECVASQGQARPFYSALRRLLKKPFANGFAYC